MQRKSKATVEYCGQSVTMEQAKRLAVADMAYALEICRDHILHDPRARSTYERFVIGTVCDNATKAIDFGRKAGVL